MTNMNDFKSDSKYKKLTPVVAKIIDKLDDVLSRKGYLYKALWRNDKESGGNVFIFEVERRRGRRKNLITLRPQQSFLIVEVYWKKDNKHYFRLFNPNDGIPNNLLDEIGDMYSIVSY